MDAKQRVWIVICAFGILTVISAEAVSAQETNHPPMHKQLGTNTSADIHDGSHESAQPSLAATSDVSARDAALQQKYKKRLAMGLIIGTIGAAWFVIAQRLLSQPSPASYLQLLIIIALILYGMIMTVLSIVHLATK